MDVAIEALGEQTTFEMALRVLRPGGTLSSLGVYSGKLQIPYEAFAAGIGDQTIVTTLCPGGKERMGRLMRMVESGRFDPLPRRRASPKSRMRTRSPAPISSVIIRFAGLMSRWVTSCECAYARPAGCSSTPALPFQNSCPVKA